MKTRSRINRLIPVSEIKKHSRCISLVDFFYELHYSLKKNTFEFPITFKKDEYMDKIFDVVDEVEIEPIIENMANLFPEDGYICLIEIPVPITVNKNEQSGEYQWDESYCSISPTFMFIDDINILEDEIIRVENKIIDIFVKNEINRLEKEL